MRFILRISSTLLLWSGLCWGASSVEAFHFSLPDTRGKVHNELEWKSKTAIVLIFVATDCPISSGYVPEMKRLNETFAGRGVAFYAVQSDATQTPANPDCTAVCVT